MHSICLPRSHMSSTKTDDMVEQLASLLLPIDALLSHNDFVLDSTASTDFASLFRNMWFLCVLFHFTEPDGRDQTVMEWLPPALARIATRTPPIVREEAHDTIVSDLEYSSVLRQEYAEIVGDHILSAQFALLRAFLGNCDASQPSFTTYPVALQRNTTFVIWSDVVFALYA